MAGCSDVAAKVAEVLRREGRLPYHAIQREFDLDADLFEEIKTELVDVKKVARDAGGGQA